mgnify:CR=1 FL=1
MGQSPKSDFYNSKGDGLPFLQGNRTFGDKYPTFDTWTTFVTKEAEVGDVIMSVRAPVGDINITPLKMCLGRGVCGLRHKQGAQEFLYYLLRANKENLINRENGTVFGSINKTDISNLEVQVPSLREQIQIGLTLKAIDDKIENNKKINHHLEQMAISIFKEEFSKKEVTNKLGDFFPVITGKKDANIAKGGEYPFFSCSQNISYTDNYSFDARAILLAGNGDFNVKIFNGKFEAYQRTYVLIPNNDEHFGYLYYAIKYFLNDITSGHRGSVIKFITKGQIEHFNIFMTSNKEKLFLFNSFVENIANNNKEIDKLSNIRDTLLPKLLSDEISVNQATK